MTEVGVKELLNELRSDITPTNPDGPLGGDLVLSVTYGVRTIERIIAALERAGTDEGRGLWECPACGFRYAKEHVDAETGENTCPACAEARLVALLRELRDAHVAYGPVDEEYRTQLFDSTDEGLAAAQQAFEAARDRLVVAWAAVAREVGEESC